GAAGQKIEIVPGRLAELRAARTERPSPAKHPLLVEADAAVAAAQARKHAVNLQYLPRLDLVASLWVRGSGLASSTLPASPGDGLVPDTANWAAGVVLSWPALELIAVRARSRVEAAQVSVADARRRD